MCSFFGPDFSNTIKQRCVALVYSNKYFSKQCNSNITDVKNYTLKKLTLYLKKIIASLLIIVLVAWCVAYIYFVTHKKQILASVNTYVNSKIIGSVGVKDIGISFFETFPHISVRLDEVVVKDANFNIHKHPLLVAAKVYLRTNPVSVIKGNINPETIVLDNAVISLFTDSAGNKNTLTFKKTDTASTNASAKKKVYINEVRLKDVKFILQDDQKKKLFNFDISKLKCNIDKVDSGYLLKVKTGIVINALMFNIKKGGFAESQNFNGNFLVSYNQKTKTLLSNNMDLVIAGQHFSSNILFDLKEQGEYSLFFETKQINFATTSAILTKHLQKKIKMGEFEAPLDADVTIKGRLKGGEPEINVNFTTTGNTLHSPAGTFTNTSFKGYFINHFVDSLERADENSALVLTNMKADWEGLPFTSKQVAITNLTDPYLQCDVKASTSLKTMNEVLNVSSFNFESGDFIVDIAYQGALSDSGKNNTVINGFVKVEDGNMLYVPRNVLLQQCNATLVFEGQDVLIKNMEATAQKSKIALQATAKNVLTLLKTDPSSIYINCNITSPKIDIGLINKMLGSRKTKKATTSKKAKFTKVSESIDKLLDNSFVNANIAVKQLVYRKFTAANVKANLLLDNKAININNASLQSLGGAVNASAKLTNLQGNADRLDLKVTTSNLDIEQCFKAFDNFGFDGIKSNNIKGKLYCTTNFAVNVNDKGEMYKNTLQGNLLFSIKDGALVNFEPLQKMSNFLLKKRDFSNIEFAELKDNVKINGQQIDVGKMEIQSTVLSLFVEGIFDLNDVNTDLLIQVPLSNLKKRKADYVPENKGTDAKRGMSVFVKAKNNSKGEIDFSYSLFRGKAGRRNTRDSIPAQ
jgi:AsmA-like C-terminal region